MTSKHLLSCMICKLYILSINLQYICLQTCSLAHSVQHCTCDMEHLSTSPINHNKRAQKLVGDIQQMHFYVTFVFVNTIGWFRVVFSVGGTLVSNTIEH